MSAQEALKLLDEICGQVSLNRASHSKVVAAVKILAQAIQSKAEPKK